MLLSIWKCLFACVYLYARTAELEVKIGDLVVGLSVLSEANDEKGGVCMKTGSRQI